MQGAWGNVARGRRGQVVAEGDGGGARCVRKSSDVRGSPPKTGISGEGASPTQNWDIRRGDQPTQAHARDGAGRGGESARADEKNAKIVWIRQGGGARDIVGNRREGQAGEEVGVGREKFHPALDARFVSPILQICWRH